MTCGILVPRPGIEPGPPAVEAWSLNHWTAREVPYTGISYRLQVRIKYLLWDWLIKTIFLSTGVVKYLRAWVSQLWYQIWPAACTFPAHELRMAFTFLNGYILNGLISTYIIASFCFLACKVESIYYVPCKKNFADLCSRVTTNNGEWSSH